MITYGKKKREDGRLLLVRKKKKKYRKFLLNFSIPLFLGLLAWVVFIYLVWIYIYLVWTNIYLVWISPGTLAQLLSFFNLFLILFVGFWGVIFMLELVKYILIKKKMSQFHFHKEVLNFNQNRSSSSSCSLQ